MNTNKIEDDMLTGGSLTGTMSSSDSDKYKITLSDNTVFYQSYSYPAYLTVDKLIEILKWAEEKGFDTVDIKNFLAIFLEYEEEKRIQENIQLYGNYGSATTAMFNGTATTTTIT